MNWPRKRVSKRNVERAEAIRKKRAELKKGSPLTPEEIEYLEYLAHTKYRGRASKWARGGKR